MKSLVVLLIVIGIIVSGCVSKNKTDNTTDGNDDGTVEKTNIGISTGSQISSGTESEWLQSDNIITINR